MEYAKRKFYDRVYDRHAEMKKHRNLWDPQCDDIVEYCRPDLILGDSLTTSEGEFQGESIVEGSAFFSELTWQRGFMGLQVGAKINWLRYVLRVLDTRMAKYFKGNDRVNKFTQELQHYMLEVYRRSNYYSEMPNFVLDGGTIGSPVMLIEEDLVNTKNVCKVPHYTQRYLKKDWFGNDIALHIEHEMTLLEAVGFFKRENLPRTMQNKLKAGHHSDMVKFLQVIYRAGDEILRDLPDSVPILGPWMEFYFASEQVEETEKRPIRAKLYRSKPFVSWHYSRRSNETYARTPAWWAIYDIKGNSAGWETLFLTAEKQADPPMIMLQQMRARTDLMPGGEVLAATDKEYDRPPKPIEQNTKYPFVVDFMDRLRGNIDRFFHVDLFMQIQNYQKEHTQPPTAYEIMRMEAEKNVQIGPAIEGYEKFMGEVDGRMMEIENNAGRLPEIPPEIQDLAEGTIEPMFVGPLAQAQMVGQMFQKLQSGMGIVEMVAPYSEEAARFKLKWPELMEKALENIDFYQDIINSQEEYDFIVQSVREEQRQMAMAEAAPKIGQAVKNLGAKTEDGSPLKELVA